MILEDKKEIRKEIKKRLSLYKDNFNRASDEITNKIISSEEYINASTVLSYMPLHDEVNVNINLMTEKKRVFIPKVREETTTIDFFRYTDKTKIQRGAYTILEPEEDGEIFDLSSPEKYGNILALIPGRAFTIDGKRLGRGKGYYDRFLSGLIKIFPKDKVTIAGVCFMPQIIPDIPTEDFDIKMDFVFYNDRQMTNK